MAAAEGVVTLNAMVEEKMNDDNGSDIEAGDSVHASDTQPLKAWREDGSDEPSLPEAHASMRVFMDAKSWWKKLLSFSGVGFIISVGYMDPGNWATDIAGGSQFGYKLLFVIFVSNLMAMFLQHLALKLGAVTDKDLAQACRDSMPKWCTYLFWFLAEIAIAACDLAEVIGSAIALNLLFKLPLWAGVLITAADVLVVLLLAAKSFRYIEAFVMLLIAVIMTCFVYEMAVASPNWLDVAKGLLPSKVIFANQDALYIAMGIVGATVMPHNLYLHSSLIQTRNYPRTTCGRKFAVKYGTVDSCLSLSMAFFVNAAILILAASAFYFVDSPHTVEEISDAYKLLAPALGAAAPYVFAIALLASGQQSTVTGTLAGQIVMEGYLNLSLPPWLRRLSTRLIAIVPAVLAAAIGGQKAVNQLLIISQVVLSFQLPFAVGPLVYYTSRRKYMGDFTNSKVVVCVACVLWITIVALNGWLIVTTIKEAAS